MSWDENLIRAMIAVMDLHHQANPQATPAPVIRLISSEGNRLT